MPHGLRDALRRRVVPGQFVNTTAVQATKLEALAQHQSQQEWLATSQGLLLPANDGQARGEVGRMSGRFKHAEGWRRHLHLGFASSEIDPLGAALGKGCWTNAAYERGLMR